MTATPTCSPSPKWSISGTITSRTSADERDPLARPLLADLTGMPPTFLCIAECDILADENREMADRLRAAGVAVETKVYRGATHSFLEAVRIAPLADRALEDAAAWLRATLKLPFSRDEPARSTTGPTTISRR